MHQFLVRGLVAAALAVAIIAAPVATVHACSCGTLEPAAAIEFADLAFVGTVAASAQVGRDPVMGGPLVRYAFEVERASRATGPIVEVAAHDDGGGSCGFTFGVGERWFVVATREDGSLRSNLCSGNLLIEGMSDAEATDLVELLPMEPVPPTLGPTAAPPGSPAPPADANVAMPISAALLIGLAAAAALALVMVLALRRGRPS